MSWEPTETLSTIWQSPSTSLVGTTNTGDYTPSAPFSDRSKLGIRIRLVLRTRIKAGGSGPQRGVMNVSVAVRRFSA